MDAGFDTALVELPAPYDRQTMERLMLEAKPLVEAPQQRYLALHRIPNSSRGGIGDPTQGSTKLTLRFSLIWASALKALSNIEHRAVSTLEIVKIALRHIHRPDWRASNSACVFTP